MIDGGRFSFGSEIGIRGYSGQSSLRSMDSIRDSIYSIPVASTTTNHQV